MDMYLLSEDLIMVCFLYVCLCKSNQDRCINVTSVFVTQTRLPRSKNRYHRDFWNNDSIVEGIVTES